MNNKMYTVEISNVCAETVYANAPKQAVQYVLKTNQLPYKILSTHDITNSMQVGKSKFTWWNKGICKLLCIGKSK